MSNIQERIDIQLETIHEDICPYVITDKQWLQENILCLLSNAVKYSSEGPVKVSVGIVTAYSTSTSSSPHPIILNSSFSSPVRQVSLPSPSPLSITRLSDDIHSAVLPETLRMNSLSSCQSECVSIDSSSTSGGAVNEEARSFLQFEVEDHGIGMSIEAQSNLFSPFQQAQALAGGTGLGLFSLSKRIEALKGFYGVKSRKDGKKGSLFWFSIPYRPDHLTATTAMTSLPVTPKALLPSRSMKNLLAPTFTTKPGSNENMKAVVISILLVDDSPSILKMCSMMLRRQSKLSIITAENGEIALKRIEEKWLKDGKGFDVVLMDLQMPVMDGLEATRRLRQMEKEGIEWMKSSSSSNHQLVFGTSANYDDETKEIAINIGFDDFLDKPFPIESLLSLLQVHSVQC